jgi:hypothetical protein
MPLRSIEVKVKGEVKVKVKGEVKVKVKGEVKGKSVHSSPGWEA